jgi:hypothetical protein
MQLMYRFFNEANIAIRQADNENLRKFIDLLIDNSQGLKTRRSDFYFSPWKYRKHQWNDFHTFISTVKNLIDRTRTYYREVTKLQNVPFIFVAHDGWDSRDNDVLEVSIHFIVPVVWLPVRMACGLKRIESKKSKSMHEEAMVILNR